MVVVNGRIVIVGAGFVGSTFAYALMMSGLASDIVLIDQDRKRAEGEAMDLNHGISFARPVRIRVGDYEDCAGASIVVITAGAAQKPDETRLDLAVRNAAVFQSLVPSITAHTRDAILLVVTNPVDVMTYVAYRLSGYPSHRVIGSGTVLDTARFRYLLSAHCAIDVKNVHAYIIGEHGDTEVPVWSLANVAGVPFDEYCVACRRACHRDEREAVFVQVRDAAYHIIERKKATYFAIGLALLEIVESILRDEHSVLTVSSYLQNYLRVSDVYLSVPAIISSAGVERALELRMSSVEQEQFHHSAATIKQVIAGLALQDQNQEQEFVSESRILH